MTPETAALHADNRACLFAHTCWREPVRRNPLASYFRALSYRAIDIVVRRVRELRKHGQLAGWVFVALAIVVCP